ncbi:hypothetical protein FGG22_gp033 [Mycobacterium phage Hammer]|uniref:Uncharacterized protein n=4 Tax=Gladiatorvirus TaxID=2948726 RepID=A0A1C9LYX2_9CAUD|nr:hypothetical protein X820_gp032 [Mycobacterium phage CloudWang3]YP_009635573.1 hypothetical protein FGG54_gp29 [Mycobacterium phage Gladiator]YP_009636598.1 hypothetical protein FGG22_gp033 [Mycobacterium phage Hammer]AOQ28096.1 hypothetical protein SEA_GRUUNAGA_82 [Mycobacterium phage Gruunaga]QAY14248.1 hypothetical protein SEA_HEXAMO_82 [Mycobacterium phage Hexamo]UQS94652.1 hypothetical protein SEA_RIFTER_83 [Mycobacterium Phage Rifter]AEJ95056.1 hypothetical protein GLADIATOR_79 [Myco
MATKLMTGRPVEPREDGSVVRFSKFGGYNYAAIRVEGMWYVTQGRRCYISQKYWDAFLDWVGEDCWGSLEQML